MILLRGYVSSFYSMRHVHVVTVVRNLNMLMPSPLTKCCICATPSLLFGSCVELRGHDPFDYC